MRIDFWTLVLQTVNVLILIWLLQKFFWRPVAGVIAQRRTAAQAMLAKAEQTRKDAEAERAGIEQTRAGFAQERAAILTAAQEEAARLAQSAEAKAAAAAQKLAAETRETLATEQQEAQARLRAQATELAVDIAGKLVSRFDGTALRAAFLDGAITELAVQPAEMRQDIAELTLTSAAELPPEEKQEASQRLAALFGPALKVTFQVDPALLGGLELQAGHLRLTNSWRADLARIREELTHDQPG
ncbi:F0F1 ATP synthase subunit delta [Acidocella aromatica]|uniref:ATP synthase subunit b n=1 Tax=Acidocella aromatica TaxID=1303579 RepID=A0A840VQ49_9PROT|nr:F0F1 ATP synthase subunit delta [Acidocella aromatica]MBB5374239.1 F-type H+-transporting ATPase subunit b [Acidocella aromatica]